MNQDELFAKLFAHIIKLNARQIAVEEMLVKEGLLSFDDIDQRASQLSDEITIELMQNTLKLTDEEIEETRKESLK